MCARNGVGRVVRSIEWRGREVCRVARDYVPYPSRSTELVSEMTVRVCVRGGVDSAVISMGWWG